MTHRPMLAALLCSLALALMAAPALALPPPPPSSIMNVTPASGTLDYGLVTEGLISDQVITLENTGNTAVTPGVVNVSGLAFTVIAEDCSAHQLRPSVSCTITGRFAPPAVGVYNGTVTVSLAASGLSDVSVDLAGTGLTSVVNNPPIAPVLVSPANGALGVNSTSATFIWNATDDPDGDMLTYALYYDTDPTFAFTIPVYADASGSDASGSKYARAVPFGLSAGFLAFGVVIFRSGEGRRVLALLLVLASAGAFTVGCGSDSTPSGSTTPVTISLGSSTGVHASAVSASAVPASVRSIRIHITGTNMTDMLVIKYVTPGQTTVTVNLNVPTGEDRHFVVSAHDISGYERYSGQAYADLDGRNAVTLNITMVKTGTVSSAPVPLSPGTTYYWKVVASDGIASVSSPAWSFTTAP